jgi:hypothetical protein
VRYARSPLNPLGNLCTSQTAALDHAERFARRAQNPKHEIRNKFEARRWQTPNRSAVSSFVPGATRRRSRSTETATAPSPAMDADPSRDVASKAAFLEREGWRRCARPSMRLNDGRASGRCASAVRHVGVDCAACAGTERLTAAFRVMKMPFQAARRGEKSDVDLALSGTCRGQTSETKTI